MPPRAEAELIESNVYQTFTLLASCYPGVDLVDTSGLLRFATGISFPMGNMILRANFPEDEAEARIAELLEIHKRRNLPILWMVGPSSQPSRLSEIIEAKTGRPPSQSPGMAAHLDGRLDESPPEGVRIEEVETPEVFADWLTTAQAAFDLPDSILEMFRYMVAAKDMGPSAPFRNFIAYLDDIPVATSSLFASNGVAGIYCVGTIAEARRKGIGAAITRAAMQAGKEAGCNLAILQSSEAGLGVYQQLGFRHVCNFARHICNREAAG